MNLFSSVGLPLFSDIGKQAKDLFEKNFFFDCVKLDMKNSLTGDMGYQASQKYTIKDSKMTGEVEVKYESRGIIFKPKVNTESLISGELKMDRAELKGINLVASGNFNPHDGKKSVTIGCFYKGPDYNIEVASLQNDPDLKAGGTVVRTNGVINLFGWLFGASVVTDPQGFKIMKTNFIGGFQDGRTSFFVNCDPQQKGVTGSVFNLVNSSIQTGLLYSLGGSGSSGGGGAGGAGKESQPSLGFAANYVLNGGATLKARINTDYLMGLSYILQIKDGINVTMCTEVDVQKLKSGGHKVGFGLEFV